MDELARDETTEEEVKKNRKKHLRNDGHGIWGSLRNMPTPDV